MEEVPDFQNVSKHTVDSRCKIDVTQQDPIILLKMNLNSLKFRQVMTKYFCQTFKLLYFCYKSMPSVCGNHDWIKLNGPQIYQEEITLVSSQKATLIWRYMTVVYFFESQIKCIACSGSNLATLQHKIQNTSVQCSVFSAYQQFGSSSFNFIQKLKLRHHYYFY